MSLRLYLLTRVCRTGTRYETGREHQAWLLFGVCSLEEQVQNDSESTPGCFVRHGSPLWDEDNTILSRSELTTGTCHHCTLDMGIASLFSFYLSHKVSSSLAKSVTMSRHRL